MGALPMSSSYAMSIVVVMMVSPVWLLWSCVKGFGPFLLKCTRARGSDAQEQQRIGRSQLQKVSSLKLGGEKVSLSVCALHYDKVGMLALPAAPPAQSPSYTHTIRTHDAGGRLGMVVGLA